MSDTSTPHPDDPRPQFLSEADCHAIAERVARAASPGTGTSVCILSRWSGNVRWARNQVISAGEVLDHTVFLGCSVNGAGSRVLVVNDVDTAALTAAVRRAERMAAISHEQPQHDLIVRRPLETPLTPLLFSQATYNLDAAHRAQVARELASSAVTAGMLSAGFVAVSARSQAVIDEHGRSQFFSYTTAQYSVTVRNPQGTGSGWAGVDQTDWNRIDGPALSKRALDKCLESRNPVALEPGRYTAILEPQAVADIVGLMIPFLERTTNENEVGPFTKSGGALLSTRLEEKLFDERVTISADPMDPDGGFPPWEPPFGIDGRSDPFNYSVFSPVAWIERGVLKHLAYARDYAIQRLNQPTGLPISGAFRMSGGPTSMDEMIATTTRGVLVTRFDRLQVLERVSLMSTGYTRDGVWLIEHGKIVKPVKNFQIAESPLFVLNNIEQLGAPTRVFHPQSFSIPAPVIVPPLRVRDFSFSALSDAV